jgi:hypothetical protein
VGVTIVGDVERVINRDGVVRELYHRIVVVPTLKVVGRSSVGFGIGRKVVWAIAVLVLAFDTSFKRNLLLIAPAGVYFGVIGFLASPFVYSRANTNTLIL